jgi:hypothetical protein
MAILLPRPDFCRASELPLSIDGSIEELEQRIKDQDAVIAEQQELIDELSIAPRLARTPSDALKDSERLILLARINDLTIANNALEFEVRQALEKLKLVVDTYLDVDPAIFSQNDEASLLKAAAKRRAIASKEFSSRILGLEDRISQIEDEGEKKIRARKTKVIEEHLDRLARELLIRSRSGQKGVTYAEAGKILTLDKSRICQLRALIASDSRFNVDWHPNRSNMKIIRLKKYS